MGGSEGRRVRRRGELRLGGDDSSVRLDHLPAPSHALKCSVHSLDLLSSRFCAPSTTHELVPSSPTAPTRPSSFLLAQLSSGLAARSEPQGISCEAAEVPLCACSALYAGSSRREPPVGLSSTSASHEQHRAARRNREGDVPRRLATISLPLSRFEGRADGRVAILARDLSRPSGNVTASTSTRAALPRELPSAPTTGPTSCFLLPRFSYGPTRASPTDTMSNVDDLPKRTTPHYAVYQRDIFLRGAEKGELPEFSTDPDELEVRPLSLPPRRRPLGPPADALSATRACRIRPRRRSPRAGGSTRALMPASAGRTRPTATRSTTGRSSLGASGRSRTSSSTVPPTALSFSLSHR